MAEERNHNCVVVLMRHGVRAEDYPAAGLKTNDSGDEHGENYIREALGVEDSDRPYELFFFSPLLVCKQTIQAAIRHSPALVTMGRGRTIALAKELYSTRPEWLPIIQTLGGQDKIGGKTFEDLYKSGDPKFILAEGERMFSFIQGIVDSAEMDSAALCVMPSPLIEAIMIYLWEQYDPDFRKPLAVIKMLGYVDYFVLVFMRRRFEFSYIRSYWERIQRKREGEALTKSIGGRLGPVIGQKR